MAANPLIRSEIYEFEFLDLCNTTYLNATEPATEFDGLDVTMSEPHDYYSTSLDDPDHWSYCRKDLYLFDESGNRVQNAEIKDGILTVPEQGNYTYHF